jgi:hypothetical protein
VVYLGFSPARLSTCYTVINKDLRENRYFYECPDSEVARGVAIAKKWRQAERLRSGVWTESSVTVAQSVGSAHLRQVVYPTPCAGPDVRSDQSSQVPQGPGQNRADLPLHLPGDRYQAGARTA